MTNTDLTYNDRRAYALECENVRLREELDMARDAEKNGPPKPAGFLGERKRVVFESSDESGFHTIRVVEYHFAHCGDTVRYVEVAEDPQHSSVAPRLISFSAAVHALQNMTDDELWSIGLREPV